MEKTSILLLKKCKNCKFFINENNFGKSSKNTCKDCLKCSKKSKKYLDLIDSLQKEVLIQNEKIKIKDDLISKLEKESNIKYVTILGLAKELGSLLRQFSDLINNEEEDLVVITKESIARILKKNDYI
jgi:hypothetical protein